ncbi:MAG: hypothetical protein HQ445_02605 [Polaromonas sp.]|nr:hypothetical protein [Polaromonas sp.]
MLTKHEHKQIVGHVRAIISKVNGFFWLLNPSAVVNHAAQFAVNDCDTRNALSWNNALIEQLFDEAQIVPRDPDHAREVDLAHESDMRELRKEQLEADFGGDMADEPDEQYDSDYE